MEAIMQLSIPKYQHIKNTFEIFDARVRLLDAQINVNTKYVIRMKEIRTRVRNLLKSHKLFNEMDLIIMKKRDPINGDIPDETLELLEKLSKPRKRDLKETLMKVNQMIREITGDYYYKENKYKLNRYEELIGYRRNICCMLKGTKFPTEIQQCHRFAPCDKKIVNIWEIPVSGRYPNSRILKIDFDKKSIELARPQYLYILNTIAFFMRLRYYYIQKASEKGRWSYDELRRIHNTINNINKRLIYLDQLEKSFKRPSFNEQPLQNAEHKTIIKYTHDIELPKRKRLEDALQTYQSYLSELRKRMGYRKKQKFHFESRVQPLIQCIERNILFTQNLLNILPPEKPHCEIEEYKGNEKKEKKILCHILDDSGQIVDYKFDDKTNELSFPKLGILEESFEAHKRILEKFEYDMKNIKHVMQRKVQEETVDELEDANEDQEKSSKDKSDKYQQLKERINRLNALIQQKKETIEYLQSILPEAGIRSNFYHHKLCFIEKKQRISSKYKAKNPHLPICTSKASKKYLENSFNSYLKWIEEKRNDVKYRNEIESILKNQNTSKDSILNDENQEDEEEKGFLKQQKFPSHTQRMIQNKLKLETYLENIKSANVDDIHLQTHAKFEKLLKLMKQKKLGPVSEERIIELATPKRTLLKFSIIRFRHLMSESKRRRLECRLLRNISKPEQIENELRQKEVPKDPKICKKPKTTERAAINQLLKRIMNSDNNSLGLDDLIRYSMQNGFQMFHK